MNLASYLILKSHFPYLSSENENVLSIEFCFVSGFLGLNEMLA